MRFIDFLLAGPLAAMTVGGVVFAGLGAMGVRLWMRERLPPIEREKLPPVTLLRPVKPGIPALAEKLGQLARAMRTDDQLVLGADADSPELAVCAAVRVRFPEREIGVVACVPGAALNPKISKLLQMEPLARHDHCVVSDSEALIDAEWLEAFREEWAASRADALTVPYRFAGWESAPQRADAAAVLLSLWPGLAVLRQLGRVRLTLGACTGLRRRDLAAIGGWAAFGAELAEDHRLGAALVEAGRCVRLGRTVATLESDPLSWTDYWRHQRRVAVTYRVCNPRGFAGMLLTHGTTAAVCMLLLAPGSGAPLFWAVWALLALIARGWCAAGLARSVPFPIPGLWRIFILAGLVETACWLLSWVSPVIWWAGRWWRVDAAGRLQAPGTAAPTARVEDDV